MQLFRSGGWYRAMRIPAIAAVGEAVVAVAVGRLRNSDHGPSDLLIRRSADGGATWSQRRVLERGWWRTTDNPTLIVDGAGRIHLFFQVGYRRLFQHTSVDGGVTWGARIDRTEVVASVGWGRMAPGPGAGARLRGGRLVLPVWGGPAATRGSMTRTLFSDDDGETWGVGDVVVRGFGTTSEATVAATSDGGAVMSVRQSRSHARVFSWSADGIAWSEPVAVEELYEPVCHAALVAVGERVAFVNPDSRAAERSLPGGRGPRENLTLRWSSDGGRTWGEPVVVDPGPSAYASAVSAGDGVHLLWEHGMRHGSWYWPAGIRYERIRG